MRILYGRDVLGISPRDVMLRAVVGIIVVFYVIIQVQIESRLIIH